MTNPVILKRTGVILAAGFGSRLQDGPDNPKLKPLTLVAGQPLIHRTLESLHIAGCDKVVIVLGFGASELETEIRQSYSGPVSLEFVFNKRYDLQNGVSVLCAKNKVEGEFVLTMADHILSRELMEIAGSHKCPKEGATLMVDYKLDAIFDIDDATRVMAKDERIVTIGKLIPEYNCVDTGVFVCTPALFESLEAVLQEKGDVSLSHGIAALSKNGAMTVKDIGNAFWQDVDTQEMLDYANSQLSS